MRKTTEELADIADAEFDDDALFTNTEEWLETFRRLVIENERECAEPATAWCAIDEGGAHLRWNKDDHHDWHPLFTFPPTTHQKCPVCGQGKLYCNACGTGITFPPAAQVPEGWKLVPIEVLDGFPEINLNNYDHDDVSSLNSWGISVVLAAAPEVK